MKLLESAAAKETFERGLERVRRWYGCYVTGYVVMPEHVHLLISEPERGQLSIVMQMLKQMTSHQLKPLGLQRFWQVRYYDFPVWSAAKLVEKLRYPSQPCDARAGVPARRVALEQLRSLCDGRGGHSRD